MRPASPARSACPSWPSISCGRSTRRRPSCSHRPTTSCPPRPLVFSFLAKHFLWQEHETPPFMLELPDYKLPRPRAIAMGLYTRAKMFLHRAGTTIFSMMVLIWFLASFPRPPEGATDPAINYSLAAMIGHALEPVLAPVGFNWQINVALIPGMAARGGGGRALGTVYAIEGGKGEAGPTRQ